MVVIDDKGGKFIGLPGDFSAVPGPETTTLLRRQVIQDFFEMRGAFLRTKNLSIAVFREGLGKATHDGTWMQCCNRTFW